ncbi:MAG: DUF739 family protein [Clostridia bacterium]|nr:DUF739 family protein [Clostridia bacterium]
MATFNYAKLLGKIKEVCGTQAEFAERMGMRMQTVNLKLNNRNSFTQAEVLKAAEVLGIPSKEIGVYFFTPNAQ